LLGAWFNADGRDFRRIGTRYDRSVTNFLAAVCSPPPSVTGYESGPSGRRQLFIENVWKKVVRRNADIVPFFRDRFATLLRNIEETPKKRAIAAAFIFSFLTPYEFMSDGF
jgi:hypothetical protein